MTKCICCGMNVYEGHSVCPLCDTPLENIKIEGKAAYPVYKRAEAVQIKSGKACKIASVAVIALLAFLNIITYPLAPALWSLNVAAPICYAWFLAKNTAQANVNGGAKVLFHLMAISILVIVVDVASGFLRWSVNFVVPFLILSTALIYVMASLKGKDWEKRIRHILGFAAAGFVPMLLFVLGISSVLWTGIMCAGFSAAIVWSLRSSKLSLIRSELLWIFHV